MDSLKKTGFAWFQKIEEKLTVLLLITMFFCILFQIITRFLGVPLSFSEELARYLYLWIAFMTIPYCIQMESSIRLEVLINKMPPKIKKAIKLLLMLIELMVMLFLLYWSIRYCDFTKNTMASALQISMLWINLGIPLGFLFAVIRSIQLVIKTIKKPE